MTKKGAHKAFPIREDDAHKIEVHVAGLCLRIIGKTNSKIQLLVGKRTEERELFPGMWECGGGQVRRGESFEEAIRRQFFEEFGIRIKALFPIAVYQIDRASEPKIPGLIFLCESEDHGNEAIVLNKREFSEYRWVTQNQCRQLRMISGIQAQAKQAFAAYRALVTSRHSAPENNKTNIEFEDWQQISTA